MKRSVNITSKLYPLTGVGGILLLWQLLYTFEVVPAFMLPSPAQVLSAFVSSFQELMGHARISLTEAMIGLSISILLAFILAVVMDGLNIIYKIVYPLMILTQTIPVVAIAPLLVLWLGYDMLPKIVLIVLTCFFPLAIGLLDGYRSVDKDMLGLMRAMGASRRQIFWHVKFSQALPQFFSALKISVAYSVVGAVIAEWLGGNDGLGVYMTRVRKSFAFDKMFAVILLISAISLLLIQGVKLLEKKTVPWIKIPKEIGDSK